jgi:hypothetical protein
MPEPPGEVTELLERRKSARAQRDWQAADLLRDRIRELGWNVVDAPTGEATVEPAVPEPLRRIRSNEVGSVLDEPTTSDVSIQWVCEGWPEDIKRGVDSFRANQGGRSIQFVVADVTGEDAARWGEDVEVVSLEEGTGWAAARNAGLRRSRAEVVVALDGSVEAQGDAVTPLVEALADRKIGIAGPFGIVTEDLRAFEPAPDEGDCDAIEGYMMAFRRELISDAGFFDEKFRWYRTADIEWSFRVKDAGYRTVVVDVPVKKHEHRMWFETAPKERERLSKRNYYRFLDRWRDRWDLVMSGEPEHSHDHHRRHG